MISPNSSTEKTPTTPTSKSNVESPALLTANFDKLAVNNQAKDSPTSTLGLPTAGTVSTSNPGSTTGNNDQLNPFTQRQAIRSRRVKRQQGSSRFINEQYKELEQLPPIKDAPDTEKQDLFIKKLKQCCVIFDFMDPVIDLKSKEIKRACLNELVDYISVSKGCLSEPVYPEIIAMVSFNIFRTLSALDRSGDNDQGEDDEPTYEASWPHLQGVYEFFFKILRES